VLHVRSAGSCEIYRGMDKVMQVPVLRVRLVMMFGERGRGANGPKTVAHREPQRPDTGNRHGCFEAVNGMIQGTSHEVVGIEAVIPGGDHSASMSSPVSASSSSRLG
jgi:hypothetical protein